jgi:hypothetical protein
LSHKAGMYAYECISCNKSRADRLTWMVQRLLCKQKLLQLL